MEDKPYIPLSAPEDFSFRFAPKKLVKDIIIGLPITPVASPEQVRKFTPIEQLRKPRKRLKVQGIPKLKRRMRAKDLSDWYILDSHFFPRQTPQTMSTVLKRYEIRMRAKFLVRRWWQLWQDGKPMSNGSGSGLGYTRMQKDVVEYAKENPTHSYEMVAGVMVWRTW